MSVKKLNQELLNSWVDGLIEKHKVFGIQAKGERFAFGPLACAKDLRLDYDIAILPPKKYFQPQKENLMTFETKGKFESITDDTPFVLLGVHPYDMNAINQMEMVFTSDNYDVHYMARRNHATIVACDVQQVAENSFAGCVGTATIDEGFDVLLTKIGEEYIADARTEKGETLIKSISNVQDVSDSDIESRKEVWNRNIEQMKKHELKPALEDIPSLLEESYDSEIWEDKSKLCFSCGSCVTTCPTCYCFDVSDDVNWDLTSGTRKREWDGCMLLKFAEVAGGHNFRKDKADRYRHRYYRKGKYVADKVGRLACVGCGRCISACVSNIANPVEVFNTLLEDKQ